MEIAILDIQEKTKASLTKFTDVSQLYKQLKNSSLVNMIIPHLTALGIAQAYNSTIISHLTVLAETYRASLEAILW